MKYIDRVKTIRQIDYLTRQIHKDDATTFPYTYEILERLDQITHFPRLNKRQNELFVQLNHLMRADKASNLASHLAVIVNRNFHELAIDSFDNEELLEVLECCIDFRNTLELRRIFNEGGKQQ